MPVGRDRPDNLFEPVPSKAATHGIFDAQAKTRSPQLWASDAPTARRRRAGRRRAQRLGVLRRCDERARSPSRHAAPHVLREYALLADGERGILVGPRGDFAWLCFPRWDSDAIFSALIGGAGGYADHAADRFVWGGYYEPGSLIWRSRWVTGDAIIECREALALPARPDRAVILRRVIARHGTARVHVDAQPARRVRPARRSRRLAASDDRSVDALAPATCTSPGRGGGDASPRSDGHRGQALDPRPRAARGRPPRLRARAVRARPHRAAAGRRARLAGHRDSSGPTRVPELERHDRAARRAPRLRGAGAA